LAKRDPQKLFGSSDVPNVLLLAPEKKLIIYTQRDRRRLGKKGEGPQGGKRRGTWYGYVKGK